MDQPRFENVASAVRDLDPDIDVTAKAIARVVGSLTGDPHEQAAIISLAATKAAARLVAEQEGQRS